jgi:Tfp pilus assembly protein FimT
MIEILITMAVSAILLSISLPLGSFWIESTSLSSTKGELSHGIGKAIATSLRNEQAVDRDEPAAVLCLSDSNQLTVLQASASELPNCTLGTGTSVWTSSIPDKVTASKNGVDVSCLCFNVYGLLTTNNCSGCTTETVLDINIGDRHATLHVL